MGAPKTYLFTAKQRAFARTAKALGHPARIAIVQYLMGRKYVSNKHLVKVTGLAETTVHQHLRELFRAGLITETFKGKFHYYTVHSETVRQVESLSYLFEEELGFDETDAALN